MIYDMPPCPSVTVQGGFFYVKQANSFLKCFQFLVFFILYEP